MSIAIFILMAITSGGIYGYLSSAYQDTATKFEKKGNEISTLVQKKSLDSLDMVRLQERYNKLTDLRSTQETRLDTLYNRKQNNVAKRTEDLINKTNIEISQLDSIIRIKNDNITKINGDILSLNSENISGEIGPLKYLSDLTGYPMNKVVNIFILLLIFVFDPLAVTMIVGANLAFRQNEEIESHNEHYKEPISKMWNWFKRKPKQKEVIVDGGELETTSDSTSETPIENQIIEEVKKTKNKINEDNSVSLDDLLGIKDLVENQKSTQDDLKMSPEQVKKYNEGIWDMIGENNEEIKEEPIDSDVSTDNSEKQIETPENEKEEENKEIEETIDSDDLNIYGENLKEVKKDTEDKKEVKQIYNSFIQDSPKSAYTPGGGIEIK